MNEGSLLTNEGMLTFATSCMMIKLKPSIGFNYQMVLKIFKCGSEDEARGLAVKNAMAQFPEHSLDAICICTV